MKKLFKSVFALALVAITMLTLSVSAAASGFEWDMLVGDEFSLRFSDTPYESSDTSVIEIRQDKGNKYIAVAVGKGTARITGGTWMGEDREDFVFTVYNSSFDEFLSHAGAFFVIAIILVLLMIAEIAYIFIEAPKCGMTRLWAIVPLFSNLLGLLVFIVVRSNRKTATVRTITCPTCNGVHPAGTTVCSICGTTLK